MHRRFLWVQCGQWGGGTVFKLRCWKKWRPLEKRSFKLDLNEAGTAFLEEYLTSRVCSERTGDLAHSAGDTETPGELCQGAVWR